MSELKEMERQDAEELGLIEIEGKWYRKNGEDLEEMIMYDPIFGWLSSKELSHLRQTSPRVAP